MKIVPGKTQGDVIMPDTGGIQKTASPGGLPGKEKLELSLEMNSRLQMSGKNAGSFFSGWNKDVVVKEKKKKKQVSDGKPQKKLYYYYFRSSLGI